MGSAIPPPPERISMLAKISYLLGATLFCLALPLAHSQDVAMPLAQPGSSPASAASRARPAAIQFDDVHCRPLYPAAALRVRAQGTTRLRFRIDGDGLVQAAEITGRSGPMVEHQLLDQLALQSLIRCSFRYGLDADGKPTVTTIQVAYTWKID
jgi:TonB family protein